MTQSRDRTVEALVSVMIPAYNAEKHLRDTLDSVYRQSYRPIEVIIIDDGSLDSTGSIITEWAASVQNDPDLTVVEKRQENCGLLACRNLLLDLARGDVLQFLDADDLLHPEKISRCMAALRDSGWDVVVPRTRHFTDEDDTTRLLEQEPVRSEWTSRELRRSCVTATPWHSVGPLFTREIVKFAGNFPEDIDPFSEELEFHGRVKLLTDRVKYLDEVLNFYRKGNSRSITGGIGRTFNGRFASARIATDLLTNRQVRSFLEWSSLAKMAFTTYWRSVNFQDDPAVLKGARRGFYNVLRAWKHPIGLFCYAVPSYPLELLMKFVFHVRRNPSPNRDRVNRPFRKPSF